MKSAIWAAALAATMFLSASAKPQTIIDDWANIKAPPAPKVAPVVVDPKTDALLLLDFVGSDAAGSGPCNKVTRPRCLASLPRVRAVLDKARANGVFVVYSVTTSTTPQDIRAEVAPAPGEAIVKSGPDKFFHTNLEELLAGKGIKRVIVTGTASEGAVLMTASIAAIHLGLNVVLPVDGMSSTDPWGEKYVAWHMTHAPGLAPKTVLTTLAELQF